VNRVRIISECQTLELAVGRLLIRAPAANLLDVRDAPGQTGDATKIPGPPYPG
jgi:hypothetical protein